MLRQQPTSTLFPYTTLFRSKGRVRWETCHKDLFPFPRFGNLVPEIKIRFDPAWSCPYHLMRVAAQVSPPPKATRTDRKSTRLNSSHMSISYAVFCLKKKKKK